MGALVLFLLIVVVSFLAPVYANRIAHTDPFVSNISGTTVVDGKTVDVVQQGGGALGLGEIPIGPTWHSNYFLGADNQGRDVAARVLYGGRASLQIGIASAVICCFVALVLALIGRLLRRLARLGPLARDGPDLGVPGLPALDLARHGAADDAGRGEAGIHHHQCIEPLGADADHRVRLHPVRLPPRSRAGALGAGEGVRRSVDLAGRLEHCA